jgi:4a-hydroxytetrahydrobiopterin dehydratase
MNRKSTNTKSVASKAEIPLSKKKCIPCEDAATKPLTKSAAQEYAQLVSGWELAKNAKRIYKTCLYKNFIVAMKRVNQVAELAEKEGHHPDIVIHYNRVDFTLYTHSIGGLSENDFILAAKMNKIIDK